MGIVVCYYLLLWGDTSDCIVLVVWLVYFRLGMWCGVLLLLWGLVVWWWCCGLCCVAYRLDSGLCGLIAGG